MDGFLDDSRGGRTELRIHGVSGTPPESILESPHPRQVAGDKVAGFWRRWWPGGQPTGEDADVRGRSHREAYSWGGLTSGAASRALWLLLLPFMLLNVAFYATPRPPVQDGGSRLRRNSARVQRLLALTLTGSLVLSVIGLAMDLVGWQCGRPEAGCVDRHGWLGFLAWRWLDEPARQLAVTSLVPAAVVGLLWYLGRVTWSANEMTEVPGRDRAERPAEGAALLEDRAIWNGGGPVGRLRAVHVATAFSLVSALLLAPLASHSGLAGVMLGLHLAVIAAIVAVTASSRLAQRDTPPATAAAPGRWPVELVPALAAALYLVTVALVVGVHPDPGRPLTGGLPWFTGAVVWTFVVQAALLLALLALTWAIGASTRRRHGAPAAISPPSAAASANGPSGPAPPDGWGLA
ncbi:MAG TPA: hypothetical protein VE776_14410, partial [Actinomycetota bacterium]|nr:hypothetical protein [Actinomycetota bacterium]